MKFEIKSWHSGAVLFSIETESWKLAVEAAVKAKADLSYADLSYANLRYANLRYANLRYANLSYADLRSADLSSADLSSANLRYADLRSADPSYANLSSANLSSANLRFANLRYAKEIPPLQLAQMAIIPSDGPFVGWKKCRDNVLVQLAIPSKARRSHSTGRKCRAEFVRVLQVIGAEVGLSMHDGKTEYRKGQTVRCNNWDENRWEECSGGIHFFITKAEAEAFEL